MSKQKRLVSFSQLCAIKGWTRNETLHHKMLCRGLPVYSGKAKLRDCIDDAEIDVMCSDLVFDLDAIDVWQKRGMAHTMPAGPLLRL
jgi:hypothetical protein